MPRSCRLIDPLAKYNVATPLGVNNNGTPIFECIRLLYGTVDIFDKESGSTRKNQFSFITQDKRRRDKHAVERLIRHMFDGDLDINDAAQFLNKGRLDNRDFWEDLKAEICLCLVARNKDRNVEAFLYLYRVLEVVSIALPLVYASAEPDYRRAMEFIKSLSKDDRDSDLTVFRNFVASAAKLGNYEELYFDFPFDGMGLPWRQEALRQLKGYIFDKYNIEYRLMDNDEGFSIKFTSIPLFFISFRNRLFHNSKTGDNLKIDNLGGADKICKILVDPMMYWFGLVLIEIIKVQAKRYV